MRRTTVLAVVLLCGSGSVGLAGESPTGEGHGHSRHHIESTFGVAYNDGKYGWFTGFEYEYRFSSLFGVGGFVDTTFSGFELVAIGAVANLHPGGRWKVLAGAGVERKVSSNKDKALFRLGAAYEFHVGNGTVAPVVAYDILEDSKDVVYAGVAIGFGF